MTDKDKGKDTPESASAPTPSTAFDDKMAEFLSAPEWGTPSLTDYIDWKDRMFVKTGGDYRFNGVCRSVFTKRSGAVRVVLENDDGMLFIFSPSQLTRV